MKSIKATSLSFLARVAFGATATTLEKAGAELSNIATTNIAISYSIDATLVEASLSFVLTLKGSKVFSDSAFDSEQTEVFVCVSDATDHNCLVSKLAINSNDEKVYTDAWAFQLTELPTFTDNEMQRVKFLGAEKTFSAEIDTATEGIKGSVTATGTSSEWSAVAESWSRSTNSWKVELKRSHTAGSSEDAKVFLDGLKEGMNTVTAGLSYAFDDTEVSTNKQIDFEPPSPAVGDVDTDTAIKAPSEDAAQALVLALPALAISSLALVF